MPQAGQSLVKAVGRYGWTTYSVLGLRTQSTNAASMDGANITADTVRMLEWPVKVHIYVHESIPNLDENNPNGNA